jgi:hypothetical protein
MSCPGSRIAVHAVADGPAPSRPQQALPTSCAAVESSAALQQVVKPCLGAQAVMRIAELQLAPAASTAQRGVAASPVSPRQRTTCGSASVPSSCQAMVWLCGHSHGCGRSRRAPPSAVPWGRHAHSSSACLAGAAQASRSGGLLLLLHAKPRSRRVPHRHPLLLLPALRPCCCWCCWPPARLRPRSLRPPPLGTQSPAAAPP